MNAPRLSRVDQTATHRLIPYHYSDRGRPILNLIAEDDEELLSDLVELEGATNDRLLGESGRLPGISTIELVSGFRFAHIVNASFTHANPSGGRFNGPERGAWYAGFQIATAQAEVVFHRAKWLGESAWTESDISQYIDYEADFSHEFHDIRSDAAFAHCLDPDSYSFSQALGRQLLTTGSAGIVYPSVRHRDGVCIACFRPPLVLDVREGVKVTFTFIKQELTDVLRGS
jgi:RES domain-containing protein